MIKSFFAPGLVMRPRRVMMKRPIPKKHICVGPTSTDTIISVLHYYYYLPTDNHQNRFFSSTDLPEKDFLKIWRKRVAQGILRQDEAQERVAKRLHRLQQALVGYSNETFFMQPPLKPLAKESENSPLLDSEIKAANSNDDGVEEDKLQNDGSHNEEGTKSMTTSEENQKVSQKPPTLPPEVPAPPPLPRVPRGLYIWGSVGTGKSLLMDTFYSIVDVPQKQRFHFHAFMANVHSRIHQLNQEDLKHKGRNFHVDTSQEHNSVTRVALQLAQETTLLCLDEFQVTDVADAMILSQLFEILFAHGTVMVATSNRPPQDLYEDGLNRSYFLPFLDILEHHCVVHSLESTFGDYRKMLSSIDYTGQHNTSSNDGPIITLPPDARFFFSRKTSSGRLNEIMKEMLYQVYNTGDDNDLLQSFELNAGFGRTMTVPTGDPNGLIGKFHFDELCDGDVGASDYRALAQHFSIVSLESIPLLSKVHHNRARRFITLIDELYEAKCALVCSTEIAVDSPDALFLSSTNNEHSRDNELEVQVGETLGIEEVQTQGGQPLSTLASVRELSFAFKRAASRLTEMTSRRWWDQVVKQDGWKKSDGIF